MDAFRCGNHAAAVFVVGGLDVRQEFFDAEDALRQINQVRAVIGEFLSQCRRSREETGVPPHHHRQIDAGQRGVIQIGSHERLGDKAGRRRKARRVVVADQVVVDGLWNVDAAQCIVGAARFLTDDAHRVRGVIAADIEEVTYAMCLEDLEYLLAILQVRLVAGRAECRGRRIGHHFNVVAGFLGEVEELLIDDAGHSVIRTIDQFDIAELAGFENDAGHRLVDDRGRSSSLSN